MTSFCVRHREEYEKACRALTRMMGSQALDLRKQAGKQLPSKHSSWHGSHQRYTAGLEPSSNPFEKDATEDASVVGESSSTSQAHCSTEPEDLLDGMVSGQP